MTIGFAFGGDENIAVSVARHEDGFLVEAVVDAPISRQVAWEVLIDYDHMSRIIKNLTISKVTSRDGSTLVLKQEGAVKYGPFTFPFHSEREIRLEPTARISVRQLSGSLKRMTSETQLGPANTGATGTRITYHAEVVPDSFLGRLFGGSFVHDGVEEQFRLLIAEMKRRESRHATAEDEKGAAETK